MCDNVVIGPHVIKIKTATPNQREMAVRWRRTRFVFGIAMRV